MYIAIEGVKGCGKSTLLERLPALLEGSGIRVALLCPTRPIPTPHPLERLAAGTEDDSVRERLYAARSNFHAAHVPVDAQLVLGDRSILTSYATRWRKEDPRSVIARVDQMENLIARPDHVILLQVPESVLLARLHARTERCYGKHDEAPERLRAALDAYRDLRQRGAEWGLGDIRWHEIDAEATPDQVLLRVFRRIRTILAEQVLPVAAA